ncbi:adenylate kinase [Methanogenium marinum]|uniref:Adenylate kinase n=1 Tax=Methanogenium marinum TaxID=348610 RepID=A0A9Q4KUX9_9EURY|nr:adenylate kinase [Methanogenium marinum]MDE4907815.1 adenylate kinase [Methanogenium marinum]
MGKKVVVTGVPGVGKTTVIDQVISGLAAEGVEYQNINFGSCMFDVASNQGIVTSRDDMRKLEQAKQRELQRNAAQFIAKTEGNVLIDTHCTVKTPKGYLAGLPEWVLKELMPDIVVLVETDEDQILMRRLGDESRVRDAEGYRALCEHQQFNRAMAASYAMLTGCTVKIVVNADNLLDRSVEELKEILR